MPSILLVIPFYNGDRGQVERLGKWIKALSKGKKIGDKLLFCSTENTDPSGIGVNFTGLFDEIKAIRQTFGPGIVPGQSAWPKACNFQFCHVARYIYEHRKDIDAWYYMEPDCLPISSNWFEELCSEYEEKKRPFYGVRASYVEQSGEARWEDGEHLIGTAFYPQDAWVRIKGYEEIERTQPNRPWDALTRNEVNPQTYFTDLILNIHGSRGFKLKDNKVSALYRTNLDPNYCRRPIEIPDKTVLIHGCKDSSLRLLMAKRLGLPQNDVLTFAHYGDLGDIIWSLPSIKEKGGGILKLGSSGHTRERMTDDRRSFIEPLLLQQPYIRSVEKHDDGYVDFDFRLFRVLHKKHSNLVKDHSEWVGCDAIGSERWLSLPPVKSNGYIIVNRTFRYHNDDFPWDRVFKTYGASMRFIGLPNEHETIEKEYGPIEYLPISNLLEVAKFIAQSQLFIGNQSVCNAINEGLKHPGIQETWIESKDCIFDNKSIVYYSYGQLDITSQKEENQTFNMENILKMPAFRNEVERIAREVLVKELG